jgi:hypothetical protein
VVAFSSRKCLGHIMLGEFFFSTCQVFVSVAYLSSYGHVKIWSLGWNPLSDSAALFRWRFQAHLTHLSVIRHRITALKFESVVGRSLRVVSHFTSRRQICLRIGSLENGEEISDQFSLLTRISSSPNVATGHNEVPWCQRPIECESSDAC